MQFKYLMLGAAASGLLAAPVSPAIAGNDKPGSAYVQCDGQPDNVTDGETAARLIGAVTLLGLFAAPHEAADASKRKFGADGVAACTSLLSGDHQEGNAKRRLGLMLGRAIHQIEAKNYPAAIADVEQARREADAAGLMADPYFVRSRGRAFDLIESAALLRMGKPEEARTTSLRDAWPNEYSLVALLSTPTYSDFIQTTSPEEDRLNDWRNRIAPILADSTAARLELDGRFSDAARLRDALADFNAATSPDSKSSVLLARAGLAHALAGDFAGAATRIAAAKANAEERRTAGKPETDTSTLVELLDLYMIVDTAHSKSTNAARPLFAARSEWVNASLGSVMAVNRRLRDGASSDQLVGGLAKSPDDLWSDHVATARAALLAKDGDNKDLFYLMPAERSAKTFQALSKSVWRTDKSKIILPRKAGSKSPMELMYLPMTDPAAALDAYVLHAALIARSRGQQGFVFLPIITGRLIGGAFLGGNRGDKGLPPELFIDANDVIAKLSPLIPQPVG